MGREIHDPINRKESSVMTANEIKKELWRIMEAKIFMGDDQDDPSGGAVARVIPDEGDHLAQEISALYEQL